MTKYETPNDEGMTNTVTRSLAPKPRQLGFRMPAEWEPHQATWISWPHNSATWPGCLDRVRSVFARLIAHLSESETVHINVNDAFMERQARELIKGAGVDGDIHFHQFATNDAWCRDYGALFVRCDRPNDEQVEQDSTSHLHDNRLAAVDWEFNSWGNKYPPYVDDNQIASCMAKVLGIERFVPKMVMEGGSIDVDGRGLLVTTESCLLNPNRNSGMRREEIEQCLIDHLGADQVVWLKGGIDGDDTDGHVDNVARFVAPGVLVTVNADGGNGRADRILRENQRRLERTRDQLGRPLTIVPLPTSPVAHYHRRRLPASYANFYIANKLVFVPVFGDANDRRACEVLKELFPDREIVPLDASDLVVGLGGVHCVTQQVPADQAGDQSARVVHDV